MKTLVQLSETTIMYSATLSESLSHVNICTRLVCAYRAVAPLCGERLIDALVGLIATRPHLIVEWNDYMLLCLVAYVNQTRRLTAGPPVVALIRDPRMLAEVMYYAHTNIVYFDCRGFGASLEIARANMSYKQYLGLVSTFVNNHSHIVVKYKYLNEKWGLNHEDMRTIFRSAVLATGIVGYVPSIFMDYDMCMVAARSGELDSIPSYMINKELCDLAIQLHPNKIFLLPFYLVDQSMWERATENSPSSILIVPPSNISEYMIRKCIFTSPENLIKAIGPETQWTNISNINKQVLYSTLEDLLLQNMDYCELVMTIYSDVCHAVEKRIQVMMIENPRDLGSLINNNPELIRFIKNELIFDYINSSSAIFLFAPKHILTERVCEMAFIENPSCIKYFPCQYTNCSMWNAALKYDIKIVLDMPGEYLTKEICASVINTHPYLLQRRPLLLQVLPDNAAELFLAALNKDPSVIAYVPSHLLTREMCAAVLKIKPDIITETMVDIYIVERVFEVAGWKSLNKYQSQSMLSRLPHSIQKYVDAVHVHPELIDNVPNDLVAEVARAVVVKATEAGEIDIIDSLLENLHLSNNTQVLDGIINLEQWDILIKYSPYNIKLVPVDLLTTGICEIAVKYDETLFEYVPNHLVTKRMITYMYSRYPYIRNSHRDTLFTLTLL